MATIKQAAFLSSSDNFHEIASFVKKVGTNPTIRDKSARFGVPALSDFVAQRRLISPFPAPSALTTGVLSEWEVSICDPTGNRTPIAGMKILCPSR